MRKLFHFGAISENKKIGANLTSVQGFFWFGWAFLVCSNLYLQELGFPASSIGLLVAINNAVAIFSTMFWGMLSDKINSVKKTLFIIILCMVIFYTLTPLLPVSGTHFVLIFFIYYTFLNIFRGSLTALIDNLSIRTCALKGINYGIVRATGSFTFTIASLLIVNLVEKFGYVSTFYAYGVVGIFILIVLFFAYDPKSPEKKSVVKEKLSLKPLLKNYHFMAFLLFSCFFYTAIAGEFSFISYYMADIGVNPDKFSTLMAVRAICEIPVLLFSLKLRAKFRLKYLLILAPVLIFLECLFLGVFAYNLFTVILCGVLFGFGNGVGLAVIPAYLFKLAPDNLKASAQSMFASVCAIAGIIGNFAGGIAYETLGARNYYISVGVFMALSAIVFFASIVLKPKLVNPADELN